MVYFVILCYNLLTGFAEPSTEERNILMLHIISNEEEYYDEMPFSYSLESFVKSNSEYSWWFKECICNGDDSYTVIFNSFITPEYRNFLLSVHVTKIDSSYNFKITKEVTELSD